MRPRAVFLIMCSHTQLRGKENGRFFYHCPSCGQMEVSLAIQGEESPLGIVRKVIDSASRVS
jgi:hypothetical protein